MWSFLKMYVLLVVCAATRTSKLDAVTIHSVAEQVLIDRKSEVLHSCQKEKNPHLFLTAWRILKCEQILPYTKQYLFSGEINSTAQCLASLHLMNIPTDEIISTNI